MNRVIELRRRKAELLAQAQTVHETGESLNEEQRTEFDALMVQVDEVNAALEREERMMLAGGAAGGSVAQGQDARGGAPAVHNRRTPDTEEGVYCRWCGQAMRCAARAMEMRASNDTTMNVTTAADGGDLVPVGHYNQIIERLRPQALHEQLAS